MSSPYYRIYLNRVFSLAKTMVIKSIVTAEAINSELGLLGYTVDSTNPQTWKYYMNLAGQYHDTDVTMQVKSLDDLTTIDFTKENLSEHRATAAAYVYGTRYYNDLVAKYPEQELLILGILNPVDIDTAINADDGTILYYDTELVESQEYSLIERLQQWVYAYMTRWNVPGYAITDEYYPAAHLGILFANLPMEILNCRLEACLTPEAHSFHIQQYLASHGGLDEHIQYLTLEQSMFLYRNIRYLQRHAGSRKTFEQLLSHLITNRNLPLMRYEMRHNVSGLPDAIYPDIEMHRISLNNNEGDGSVNYRTIADLMNLQLNQAPGNKSYLTEELACVAEKMENSRHNTLPTKVLESAVLDTTDCVPYPLEDVLFQHWIYLSATDRYTSIITVTNPYNGEQIALNAKEAFVFFLYVYNKAMGITLTTVPAVTARRVRKPTVPSVADLRALVDPTLVSDLWLTETRLNQPAMGEYVSIESFQDFCYPVYQAMNQQYFLYAQQGHYLARAMLDSASSYLYQDVYCDPYVDENYATWMFNRSIDISMLSIDELDTLATSILNEVGVNAVSQRTTLKDIQRSMLEIMKSLSSYSVQYIQSINDDSYHIVDPVFPRATIQNSSNIIGMQLESGLLGLVSEKHTDMDFAGLYTDNTTPLAIDPSAGTYTQEIDIDPEYELSDTQVYSLNLSMGTQIYSITDSAL